MPRLQQGPFALCSSSCPPASLSRRPPCFQDPHPAVGALSLPAPGGQARAAEWDSGPSSQLCGTGYVKSLYLRASGSFRYASPSPASFPLGWGPPAPRTQMHPLAPEVPPPGSPPRSRRSPGAPPGPELRGACWIHPPHPCPGRIPSSPSHPTEKTAEENSGGSRVASRSMFLLRHQRASQLLSPGLFP